MNNGGAIHPTKPGNYGYDDSYGKPNGAGMTLRQWYAGQAMMGFIAGGVRDTAYGRRWTHAADAFAAADAMIAFEQAEKPAA